MTPPEEKKFRSYVPDKTDLREFTIRAIVLGLLMTVVLGAANLYLGLRAGMTIAATYPAAVIGMAILRLMKGSILEENMARTIGSIGESVAAGAVFTIPAFVLAGVWPAFDLEHGYWKSVALMAVGGTLGILFVTLLRRVMVEDPDLPFPESVAASEIHKAGQQGAKAAQILFANMGIGAVVFFLGAINLFAASRDFLVHVGELGKSMVKLTRMPGTPTVQAGAMTTFSAPAISPAYLGVGYIIGPRLGALNFAGGVFAWGLLVPLLIFFLGPQLQPWVNGEAGWADVAGTTWYNIVRPIAVGGMMVGASFTLFRMRKNLGLGMKRAVADLRKSAAGHEGTNRTERDLNSKVVFGGLAAVFVCMVALYYYLTGQIAAATVAAIVMIVLGFFFAAVSGNLVGMIGSSNNPVSGLTLCTLVVAALLMAARQCGHRRRARRGGGSMRVLRGGGRDAAGPKGRIHSGRHAGQDANRRSAGHRGIQYGVVLPPDVVAPRLHLRHTATFGAAGGADGVAGQGDRGRQHGVAAGGGWHLHGLRSDPGRGQKSHAVLGGHVPAARDDLRDFHRRPLPLGDGQVPRRGRLQRRSEGAHRECRCADGVGADRGRGAVRTAGGGIPRGGEELRPRHPAGLDVGGDALAVDPRADWLGGADDPVAAEERRPAG